MRLIPGNLRKTVTTAGTRVPLSATPFFVTNFSVQSLPGNTGVIYVGDLAVASTLCSAALPAGGAVTFSGTGLGQDPGLMNLAEFFIDASIDGQGVNVGYQQLTPGMA